MGQILHNPLKNQNISKPVPAGIGFTCPCQNIIFSFRICRCLSQDQDDKLMRTGESGLSSLFLRESYSVVCFSQTLK